MNPIAKYLTLKALDEEIKTSSGLVLTGDDISKLRYKKGLILGVGDEVDNLKKGDTILYDKSNSFTMIINEVQVTIIQYRDVVAVF